MRDVLKELAHDTLNVLMILAVVGGISWFLFAPDKYVIVLDTHDIVAEQQVVPLPVYVHDLTEANN